MVKQCVTPRDSLSVFLVDDSSLVRGKLASLITTVPGIEVSGEAENVPQAIAAIAVRRPDVVILDLDIPGGSGLDVLRVVKGAAPATVVIILSMHSYHELGARSLEAGADFYFEKGGDMERVLGLITELSLRGHTSAAVPPVVVDDALGHEVDSSEFENPAIETMAANEVVRHLMNSGRDCIKVLALDGRLLWMSEGGLRAMAIADLTFSRDCDWTRFWQGTNQQAAVAAVTAARARGTGTFTGSCLTKTGVLKWWEVVVTPILNAAGEPEQLLAVSRDVTERMRAEGEIQAQLQELQRWHEATLGREERIMELKREVNELLGALRQPPRYANPDAL